MRPCLHFTSLEQYNIILSLNFIPISSNINEVIRTVLNPSFFYDKILQVQKSIKTQFQFFIKCRLKVDLVLFFYDKISQVQKSIKMQVQFFIKCRLKVNLVLFFTIYFTSTKKHKNAISFFY